MANNAESSHGALVKMELDPTGSPGTFTTIGLIQDVVWPELSRAQTLSTGQESTISCYVSTSLLMVGSIDLTFWYSDQEPTHAIASGLLDAIVTNEERGFQFIGPTGGTDIFICSGHVSAVGRTAPVNEGVVEGSFSMQPNGAISIDGTAVS